MESKWISVKDRLPNKNDLVIVGYHEKIRAKVDNLYDYTWVCAGQINDDGKWYNQWQDSETEPEIYPTHWMPLPKPPNS